MSSLGPFCDQSKFMKYIKHTFIGITLAAIGVAVAYLVWSYAYTPQQYISAIEPVITTEEVDKPTISGEPIEINFQSQSILINIVPGYYDKNSEQWTTSNDKAHFATVTSVPNNKTGNTFIYGHNRSEVFMGLIDSQLGDIASIKTDNGHEFKYVLTGIHDTVPEDVSYLQPTAKPTLTVQTCSGPMYQYRRMMVFSFVEVV